MTKPEHRGRNPFRPNKGGRPATGLSGRPIGFRLPTDLLARLDAYCESRPLKPGRTAVVRLALEQFLNREQAAS